MSVRDELIKTQHELQTLTERIDEQKAQQILLKELLRVFNSVLRELIAYLDRLQDLCRTMTQATADDDVKALLQHQLEQGQLIREQQGDLQSELQGMQQHLTRVAALASGDAATRTSD